MNNGVKKKTLAVGSRKSKLARAQTETVMRRIEAARPEVQCRWVGVSTKGDRFRDRPLAEVGGKGLFVKEIEQRLLDGEIDIAVHSGKDLPADETPTLTFVSTPPRETPYDVLLAREALPRPDDAMLIGTGSMRRSAQLRRRFPHARIEHLRGNIDTRLQRLREGRFDAIVLAASGLARLGLTWEGPQAVTEWMLPAVAQGTLVLQCRRDDAATIAAAASAQDEETWCRFQAERQVQQAVDGDCFLPFGVFARLQGDHLQLEAAIWADDGGREWREQIAGSAAEPVVLGRKLGERLRRVQNT